MNNGKVPYRDVASCPYCRLRQFVRADTICRRCLRSLGIAYYEFALPARARESLTMQHSASLQIVGSIIRKLRKKQGLTQSSLAHRLDTHRTHLSRIERARLLPRSDFLLRCVEALGADKIILRIRDQRSDHPDFSNDTLPPGRSRFSP